MKTILTLIMVAAMCSVAVTQPTRQEQEDWMDGYAPRNIFLASPASGHWATIERCIGPQTHGYEPQCTVLFTSWQPVVREVASNRWQVTFILPTQK